MAEINMRKGATLATLLGAGVLLSGCFGPTYGTGVTAGDQLVSDLGNSLSIGQKNPGPKIDYKPRPAIVKPADTSVLPAPQDSVVDSSSAWPESPEQRRQRVLKEIEDGNRPSNFITSKEAAAATGAGEGPGRNAGVAGQRVYLTDPPLEYRQPAATAEYGDLGVSEAKKERARKKAQGKQTGLKRLFPWL